MKPERRPASDLFEIEGGTQPPKSEFFYAPGPGLVRFVQIRDFDTDQHATYIKDSPRWRKCKPEETLIARYGASVGRICRGLEGAYNVALTKVVPKPGVDPDYLHYLLCSEFFQGPLILASARSAQAGFNKDDLRVIELPVLHPTEQPLVGRALRRLDDKIDVNQRINETLEAMAQAIFQDWFVDFGPVRRKLSGERDPLAIMGGFASDPGHATELASLFPDALAEDGLPFGWCARTVGEIAVLHRQTVAPGNQPDQLFEHYSLPAYDAGAGPALDLGADIKSNKTAVPAGAVLLSKLNPEISRVWVPDDPSGLPQISSTEFLVCAPTALSNRALLSALFRSEPFKRTLEGMVTGTSKSHQRVNASALLAVNALCLGGEAVTQAYGDLVEPMVARQLSARIESRALTETRDYLLPRLMSGKLRVADGEAAAAA